jgi:drug/metabolite transporter (DMT)-like permease
MTRISGLPYVLIVLAGLIWGVTFSLTIIATADAIHPVILTAVQSIICSVLFALICVATRVKPFRLRNLRYYAVLAVLGISAPNLLYFSAASHLSAGILSITVSTVPMLTYVLAWMLKLESLEWKRASGIVLGMLAIILLVLPDNGLESSDASFWTLAVLVCAVCYSIENLYISEGIDKSVEIRELLCGSNIVAAVILFPVMSLQGFDFVPLFLQSNAIWAVFGISFCSTMAYMMFFYSIRVAGPVFASQCAYIVTIAGVLWGIVLLSEVHSIWVWVSVVVMLAGLALVSPVAKVSR